MKILSFFIASFFLGFLLIVMVSQDRFVRFRALFFPDSPGVPNTPIYGTATSVPSPVDEHALFYGVNVDMSLILPTSEKYVVNTSGEDLVDTAAKLGINFFRITNNTRGFENGKDSVYTHEEWMTVLDKLRNKNIRALILIETASSNPDFYKRTIGPEYLRLTDQYIASDIFAHPAVYGVDLKNEPMLNDHNIAMIKTAAQRVKAAYPAALLTVGWWSTDTFTKDEKGKEIVDWDIFSTGKRLDDITDFYSIHLYDFDKSTLGRYPDPYTFSRRFISKVRNELKTTKPFLIEEFGAANGDAVSDQDTVGSPQLQANAYMGVYQALRDIDNQKILGSVAYQFHSQTRRPDGWAIIKNGGDDIFPAAYVLQKFSTGNTDIPLTLPMKDVPNSYLFENDHHTETVTLKVNDRVGFKLSLNPSYRYTVTRSDPDALTLSEELWYNKERQKFYAVYHASRPGSVQFQIKQPESDRAVFSMQFAIQ